MKKLIALAVSGLLASTVMAGGDKHKDKEMHTDMSAQEKFNMMDTDGTSTLTRAEVAASVELSNDFVAADVDQDGELSQEEFMGWKDAHDSGKQYSASETYDEAGDAIEEVDEEADQAIDDVEEEADEMDGDY